jgi:hypothetical protein
MLDYREDAIVCDGRFFAESVERAAGFGGFEERCVVSHLNRLWVVMMDRKLQMGAQREL